MMPNAHFNWSSGYALETMIIAAIRIMTAENPILASSIQSLFVNGGRGGIQKNPLVKGVSLVL